LPKIPFVPRRNNGPLGVKLRFVLKPFFLNYGYSQFKRWTKLPETIQKYLNSKIGRVINLKVVIVGWTRLARTMLHSKGKTNFICFGKEKEKKEKKEKKRQGKGIGRKELEMAHWWQMKRGQGGRDAMQNAYRAAAPIFYRSSRSNENVVVSEGMFLIV